MIFQMLFEIKIFKDVIFNNVVLKLTNIFVKTIENLESTNPLLTRRRLVSDVFNRRILWLGRLNQEIAEGNCQE